MEPRRSIKLLVYNKIKKTTITKYKKIDYAENKYLE